MNSKYFIFSQLKRERKKEKNINLQTGPPRRRGKGVTTSKE